MSTHLFIGVPKSGKTLAMQDMVRDLHREFSCFVIDRAHEWLPEFMDGSENWRWREDTPNIVRAPAFTNADEALEFAMEYADPGNVVTFETIDGWTPWQVAKLCGQVGDTTYVDDEIDIFATYKEWKESPLNEYLNRGRHTPNIDGVPCEVHILGACRQPQAVHTQLTSLANEAFIFRCQGEHVFKRLVASGYLESEMVDEVRKAPNLHFRKWTPEGKIIKGHLLAPDVF